MTIVAAIVTLSGMAAWRVTRTRSKIAVIYVNAETRQTHDCGPQHPDVAIGLLLDWIIVNADPGDWVTLDGKPVLVIQRPAVS